MNLRITGISWLLFLLVGIILSGCLGFINAGNSDDQVKFLIGVSQANLTEPWRVVMNREIEEESAKHKDIRTIFTDAAQSNEKQIRDVQSLLNQGIDLLIISPNDTAALTPIVKKAYQTIPVIILDRAIEGYNYTLFIGPDNRLIGRNAGQLVANILDGKGGNIIEIQGLRGSPPVRERSEGFREVISQYYNIKILDQVIANWQRDMAEDKFNELINKFHKIDVVFAHNDPMAYGAYKAATKFGKNQIKYIGVDGLPGPYGGLELVKNRVLEGTFICPTGGREAIQYGIDILNHVKGIPKKIILRSKEITKSNVENYLLTKNESNNIHSRLNRKIVLGFSQIGKESEWRAANTESIKSACAEAGIELILQDAERKQENQIKAIRSFIKRKVDVIGLAPIVETGWEEVLREAKTAGIPVVLSDRMVKVEDDSLWTTYIGSDWVEEGRRAARWLVEKMKAEKGCINIVEMEGTFGSSAAISRKKGFGEIIAAYPRFQIVTSQVGDFTVEQGKGVMKEILKVYGREVNALYAHNDEMALGAIAAIEEFGLKPGKDIIIVSIDGSRSAFKAMSAGKLNCTVECSPILGPQLVKIVRDIVNERLIPLRIIASEGVFPAEVAKREYRNRKY